MTAPGAGRLLTRGEVADLFKVAPTTVTSWWRAGKLSAQATLGGHRRYREDEVRALIAAGTTPRCDLVDSGEL